MKTKELIQAIEEQTNFIVLGEDEGPLSFCYPMYKWEGAPAPMPPRSEVLATLPQEAISMQEFKEEDIDWGHYKYLKPKQREVTKLYELLNKYTETPIFDRIDDSYFWQKYLRKLGSKIHDVLFDRIKKPLAISREIYSKLAEYARRFDVDKDGRIIDYLREYPEDTVQHRAMYVLKHQDLFENYIKDWIEDNRTLLQTIATWQGDIETIYSTLTYYRLNLNDEVLLKENREGEWK